MHLQLNVYMSGMLNISCAYLSTFEVQACLLGCIEYSFIPLKYNKTLKDLHFFSLYFFLNFFNKNDQMTTFFDHFSYHLSCSDTFYFLYF